MLDPTINAFEVMYEGADDPVRPAYDEVVSRLPRWWRAAWLAAGSPERTKTSRVTRARYAYGLDVNVPTRLQLGEWWRSESALHAHLRTPHLREFRTGLRKLGGSRGATVKRYAVDKVSDLVLPPLR